MAADLRGGAATTASSVTVTGVGVGEGQIGGGVGGAGARVRSTEAVGKTALQRYQVLELLGQGTYGRVYRVRRRIDGMFISSDIIHHLYMSGLTALNDAPMLINIGEILVLKQIAFDGMTAEEQEVLSSFSLSLHSTILLPLPLPSNDVDGGLVDGYTYDIE
jgi:hypothetical protein